MAAGELNAELSGRMLREGHTIKGTGRVMGYEGIAQGGETCELVWRWIQQGDLQPSSMLARTLEHLAAAIPEALGASDHDVLVAIDTIRAMVDDKLIYQHRHRALNPDNPFIRGTAQNPVSHPMVALEHFRSLAPADIRGIRNTRGIIIGTARVIGRRPVDAAPVDPD